MDKDQNISFGASTVFGLLRRCSNIIVIDHKVDIIIEEIEDNPEQILPTSTMEMQTMGHEATEIKGASSGSGAITKEPAMEEETTFTIMSEDDLLAPSTSRGWRIEGRVIKEQPASPVASYHNSDSLISFEELNTIMEEGDEDVDNEDSFSVQSSRFGCSDAASRVVLSNSRRMQLERAPTVMALPPQNKKWVLKPAREPQVVVQQPKKPHLVLQQPLEQPVVFKQPQRKLFPLNLTISHHEIIRGHDLRWVRESPFVDRGPQNFHQSRRMYFRKPEPKESCCRWLCECIRCTSKANSPSGTTL